MEALQEQKSKGIEKIIYKNRKNILNFTEKIDNLEKDCGVELLFRIRDSYQLRAIAMVINNHMRRHLPPDNSYIQTINEQNLTYTIVRKE